MMNLEVGAKELAGIGKYLEESSGRVDILKLEALDGVLFGTTTSPESRLSMEVGAEVSIPGDAILSIRKLLALARSVGDGGKLILTVDGDTLSVRNDQFTARLPLLPADLYTGARTLEEGHERLKLEVDSFKRAISAASHTLSAVDDGGWGSNFYIETGGTEGIVVTSDRAQITSMRFRLRDVTGEEQPVKMSLPGGFVQTMIGISTPDLMMATDGRMVRFRCEAYLADFALANKLMPSIRPQIMKSLEETVIRAVIPRDALIHALGVATEISSGSSKAHSWLDLSPEGQWLRLDADRKDEFTVRFAGSSTGSLKFYFDPRRLGSTLRALKSLNLLGEGLDLHFGAERQPMILPLSEDREDFYALAPQVGPGGGK